MGRRCKKTRRVVFIFSFHIFGFGWKNKNQKSFDNDEHLDHYLKFSFPNALLYFVFLGEGVHRNRSHVFIRFCRTIEPWLRERSGFFLSLSFCAH